MNTHETCLPAYELDDGPLTEKQLAGLRQNVETYLPRGKLISRESLFTNPNESSWEVSYG